MPTDQSAQSPEKELLLDELDEKFAAFQAFRKSDTGAADEILGSLGAHDEIDRTIVLELSSPAPLGHPDRFPDSHRLAIRALEVLDRNGGKSVRVRGAGPLSPVAAFLVQQVATFIVRSHQGSVADKMLDLYGRREANAGENDPCRYQLMRARMQMERLKPGFKRNALGVPLFVAGGAVFSTLLSLIQKAIVSALSGTAGRIIATVVIGLIMLGVGWVILRGAAVARRRIHLSLDGPIEALWQTIGRCGPPPQDPSRAFALIAVILALLPWIPIPTGLLVSGIAALF
ncbi:MAG: hypothetical protein OEP52_11020 [Acidimicrobiia bacterium]|nr:hypothetical protein [Acidimicrobiia bacterium]